VVSFGLRLFRYDGHPVAVLQRGADPQFNPFQGSTAFFAGFLTLVPVLLFNFVGFELPNSAGDEMTDPQKDIPYGIARSAVLSVLLYSLPILGVLLVLLARRDLGARCTCWRPASAWTGSVTISGPAAGRPTSAGPTC
jgi:amino acid transporter